MKALRVVRGLGSDAMGRICAHPAPLPLEVIHLRSAVMQQLVAAMASASAQRALPDLRVLDLSDTRGVSVMWAHKLRQTELGARLELVLPAS
jgi:hypothetical protein